MLPGVPSISGRKYFQYQISPSSVICVLMFTLFSILFPCCHTIPRLSFRKLDQTLSLRRKVYTTNSAVTLRLTSIGPLPPLLSLPSSYTGTLPSVSRFQVSPLLYRGNSSILYRFSRRRPYPDFRFSIPTGKTRPFTGERCISPFH